MRVRFLPALLAGCLAGAAAASAGEPVRVPADQPWTPTSVELSDGQPFQIHASGRATMVRGTVADMLLGYDHDRLVGPEGTYVWPRRYPRRSGHAGAGDFPLPAVHAGPHPAFSLIAKIGDDGPPFAVGAEYAGRAGASGRLWLGINDDDYTDNRGEFLAVVDLEAADVAPLKRPRIAPRADLGPAPNARVLLLYVDGLRPDVVEDMAARGYLPNIRRTFLEQGLWVEQAFSTFPSNTLTANGALFTGLWPDRTAIKSQNQFERTTLVPRGQRSEWFGDWLSKDEPAPRVYDLLDKFAPENTYRFLRDRNIPTLDVYLGLSYRYTILPIAPISPPERWLHQAFNTVRNPLAASRQVPRDLDRINARYLIEELLSDPQARVIAAWFPMVDKVSHHAPYGQFGSARRDLVLFDRALGSILARLRQLGRDGQTYLMLVSDHGHAGGETAPNRRANLANEFFHQQLGCNVKVVGSMWQHPGNDPERFVFIDPMAWGQAAIFLPKGHYHAGPWRPNTLGTLTHYVVGPNRVVDLVQALLRFRGSEWSPGLPRPVDLAMVKLDAARVLVVRDAENQAIIHRLEAPDGTERFRYEPVRHASQSSDGAVHWEAPAEGLDPLGYAAEASVALALGQRSAAQWLSEPHTAQEWLLATAGTDYPDAVVGIAKFFNWKPPMDDLAAARDPDLVVTASRGWSFRSADDYGTDHGSPLREAMRITWYVAGPQVRRGILTEPHRIIDILPTILDMVRHAVPETLDGRPLTGIYDAP